MQHTILIVDDNAVTRKLVRLALEREFVVVEAEGAGSALAQAHRARPSLILQDMVLPDIDGFSLLAQLRSIVGPEIPILAFTGLLTRIVESRLGNAGFDDVVSKPIDPARLRDIIRGHLPDEVTAKLRFGAQKRVVLADDDAIQRKLTAYRLGKLGFEVESAVDGEQALSLARSRPPDAIVSDVLMPRMDGFELCSQVRADSALAGVPVVLLTNSYLEASDFDLARRVGADSYLVRTPELTELATALETALGTRAERVSSVKSIPPELQKGRVDRALRQLDRQVTLNTSLSQQNAMLSAELAILGGLTTALAEHGDLGVALDTALSACFDAGGISWGVLLTRGLEGWTRRVIGLSKESLRRIEPDLVRATGELALPGAPRAPRRMTIEALHGTEATSVEVLCVPIVHGDELLGSLLLGAGEGLDEHRVAFAGVIAGQIALTMKLGGAFDAIAAASRAERARVRLLESILDGIDQPIVVIDPDFHVTHWNRAAEAMGVASRPPDPRDWPKAMHLYEMDQRTPYAWERLPIVRALRGESTSTTDLVALPPGKPPMWLAGHARPVIAEDGNVECAVAVLRDVTEERRAQASRIQMDRMASIGILAAGVAHEINNPLSAVVSELDMAIEDTKGLPVVGGLQVAREAAERVRVIVRDLKSLSRESTDELEPVDLRPVIEAALRLSSAETRLKAMVVRELEEVPAIRGNASRLGQVFVNLIVNAAQAIPAGNADTHRITVRTRRVGESVIAEIGDTGTGMSSEVQARLFTPFFTTKPAGVGTGLGLSICHGIITAAGGTIEVDSAPGAGTTFRLRFPAIEEEARASTMPGPSRLRILVVDDDPLIRQQIARLLRPIHEVELDATAAVALARIGRGEAFDLVLYDLDMPAVSGAELHARVARHRPLLLSRLVFLCPGGTSPEASAFVAQVGALRLDKPLNPRALRALLEKWSP